MGELSQTELLRRVLVGLLEKGMTMHSALKSILADQKGSLISSLIEKMADQVWQGYSLVPIMEQHGEFFSREYIDAVRDFETTGTPGPRLTALLKK